jgi:putative acetyltransferase
MSSNAWASARRSCRQPLTWRINGVNLLRLELEVYSDHEPAVRLYKRFGFAIEGTLVRYAYRAGQYVDVYTMARFKQE